MKTAVHLCPCGSKQQYEQCCAPFLNGEKLPPSAEALMRSRYTAYTQANIAYIQATMKDKASENFNPEAAKHWAKKVKWRRLKVLRACPHETEKDRYYVEFSAYFIENGLPQTLNEISEFHRVDGRWFYVNKKC